MTEQRKLEKEIKKYEDFVDRKKLILAIKVWLAYSFVFFLVMLSAERTDLVDKVIVSMFAGALAYILNLIIFLPYTREIDRMNDSVKKMKEDFEKQYDTRLQ
jgi:hypothetical protein